MRDNNAKKRLFPTSLLLAVVALIFVTAVTAAWFSISDTTRLNYMDMDISAGAALRFDLSPHQDIAEYTGTLSFAQIADHIQQNYGFDPQTTELTPLTTENYTDFMLRSGKIVPANEGSYLEFTLHFMAAQDMVVHLTSADSRRGTDGTAVTSDITQLPEAMRISFTVNNDVMVYDPGMGADAKTSQHNFGKVKVFGLPSAAQMVYNDQNSMFYAKAYTDIPVVVHIWMEGTDEACTNSLKGGSFAIQLRFVGTDEDNEPLDTPQR